MDFKSRKRWGTKPFKRRTSKRRFTSFRKATAEQPDAMPRQRIASTGVGVLELLVLAHAVRRAVPTWIDYRSGSTAQPATWEAVYAIHQDADAFEAFRSSHPSFRIVDNDEAAAATVLAWAAAGIESADAFRRALAIAVTLEDVEGGGFPLVCDAVDAYGKPAAETPQSARSRGALSSKVRKPAEKARESAESRAPGAKATRKNPSSRASTLGHIGTVGDRSVLSLTLTGSVECKKSGRFAQSYRLRFRDEHGNQVLWFSSREPLAIGLDYGQPYALRATIRDHREYRGIKQTVITRGFVVTA